jgi:beta-N-acetylhexosaminidase
MDLRSLAGQLLILGFDGTELTDSLRSRLRALAPGGVILFARNLESPRQTHALLKAAQKASQNATETPLFRCVDMEGGTVDRLRDVIDPVPSVQEVVQAGHRSLYREHGRLIGGEVHAMGFNVDFAPVVDLRLEASLNVLGSRTVSADAEATVAYARGFLRGLKDAAVLGCGKHFPGLGEGRLDSHKALPVVDKSWKALWNEDLIPYRQLAARMPFVMVAHCAFPQVTGESVPASISKKWISGILRQKIGYKGLIVSDDLEMGGVLNVASIEEAAVETIRAGADMYLVCHSEELVERAWEAVLREAERDRRFRATVETAARRVLAAKRRWPAMRARIAPPPGDAVVNRLRQKIWLFEEAVRLETNTRAARAVE